MTTRYTMRTWLGLAVLFIGAVVTFLNLAVLSPLLRPIGQEFGTSDAETGQLATLGAVVAILTSLAATPWMDRWSRRTWFRLQGSVVLIAIVISALAPSFAWLAAGRMLAAFGGAVFMANCLTGARELFQDTVWRNRAIGLIVSATTIGFFLGLPVVTLIEARFGWRVAMGAVAIPVALLLAGACALPSRPTIAGSGLADRNPLATIRGALRDVRTRSLVAVLGLDLALYSGWLIYFGAYTTDVFAVPAEVLSTLFFLGGASQLLGNNLTPLLLQRCGAVHVLFAAFVAVGAALLLTGIAVTTVPGALIAAVVVLNGTGAAYVAANAALLANDVSRPGAVMSLMTASTGAGRTLGPLLTGSALAAAGSFEAAYRALGLVAPVAMVVLWWGTRQRVPEGAVERA